jgi:predicted amidohydrolase
MVIPERYANYEKVVTVGAVNFASIAGDKEASLTKIEANVREAAAQGVDIVVFPEEALI